MQPGRPVSESSYRIGYHPTLSYLVVRYLILLILSHLMLLIEYRFAPSYPNLSYLIPSFASGLGEEEVISVRELGRQSH